MSILDARSEFCDATALNTGGAASYIIGDVYDTGATDPGDIGTGLGELYIVITVDATAASGGSATGTFSLVTDNNASLTSPAVLISSKAWAVADMIAGTVLLAAKLPIEGTPYERYIGIQQTTGTAAFTAGKVNAFLTKDVSRWSAYPDAI